MKAPMWGLLSGGSYAEAPMWEASMWDASMSGGFCVEASVWVLLCEGSYGWEAPMWRPRCEGRGALLWECSDDVEGPM